MKRMASRIVLAAALALMVPASSWGAKAFDQKKNALVAPPTASPDERRFPSVSPAARRYYTSIRDKISRHWVQPNGLAKPGECHAEIYQAPGGMILDVRIMQCPGPDTYPRSVKQAILKSDPLPAPQNAEDFHAKIYLVFKPQ